jgi:hypothetical protein
MYAGNKPARASKQPKRGSSNFWKLAAAVLCAIQLAQYFLIRSKEWPGDRPQKKAEIGSIAGENFVPIHTTKHMFGTAAEAQIEQLHKKLQTACGHRGVAVGDRQHLDSRKGPSKEVAGLLQSLEDAYKVQGAKSHSFAPPRSRQRDGTAPWRDWEFSCFSQCGDDGLLYRIFGVLGWGKRRSVEIGYFPHEANSVNLIVSANFTGLLMDGNTDPLVARSWYASVSEYLEILVRTL